MLNKAKQNFVAYCPLLLFCVLFCLLGFELGDYKDFAGFYTEFSGDIIGFIAYRYATWSSRLWLEGGMFFLSVHRILFYLLSFFSLGLTFHSIYNLFGIKNKKVVFICNIVASLVVNIWIFNSAGVMATTVVCLFPLSLFLYSWVNFRKLFNKEEISKARIVLSFIALAFAVCSEVYAALSLLICLCWIGFCVVKKYWRNIAVVIPALAISVLGTINVLLSPGNTERKLSTISAVALWYNDAGVIKKAYAMVLHIFDFVFVTQPTFLFGIVAALAVLFIIKRKYKLLLLLLPMVLYVITVLCTNFRMFFSWVMWGRDYVGIDDFLAVHPVWLVFWYVLIVVLLLYGIYRALNKKAFVFAAVTLTAGVLCQIMMVMSPSMFVSNDRPMFLLYFMIFGVVALIINEIVSEVRTRGNKHEKI